MKTYIIEEVASYYVKAKSEEAAEKKFLNAISLNPRSGIQTEIHGREIYLDPEQRMTPRQRRVIPNRISKPKRVSR